MSDDLPPDFRRVLDKMHAEKIEKEFAELDVLRVTRFSDKELAAWQFKQEPGTPQYIVADHEWQRRLIMRQVRTAYRTAWIGVVGTLLGTLLGAILVWWLATAQPTKAGSFRAGPKHQNAPHVTMPTPHG